MPDIRSRARRSEVRASLLQASSDAQSAKAGLSAHAVPLDVLVTDLGTDINDGLSTNEAAARLAVYGTNVLPEPTPQPVLARLVHHLREPMSMLLIAAALVAGVGLQEVIDAAAILSIVAVNAAIALLEEGRAAAALLSLRRLEAPTATVVRNASLMVVSAAELVPGDVVVLQAGDRVPADVRLALSAGLETDESSMTGESLPVAKDASSVQPVDTAVADQRGMALGGTVVTSGSGRGIVTATGPRSELGRIATSLRQPIAATPLQRQLATMTARLGTVAVIIAAGVFALTFVRRSASPAALQDAFLSAVALAVAAVPEGLATVTVVALALGVRRMAAQGAIVRRLPAVETLGSTTLIAVDKTGTLTENRMRVAAAVLAGGQPTSEVRVVLSGRGAQVAALCNDATLEPPTGDPTEIALLEALGLRAVADLREAMPRIGVAAFTSKRRRMSTVHADGARFVLLTKGAPEVVVPRCAAAQTGDRLTELSVEAKQATLSAATDAAERGGRVLALAWRLVDDVPDDLSDAECALTLAGLIVLRDPIRTDAAATVAAARGAGVRVLMITGDHPGTARAVAAQAGIGADDLEVMTGVQLRRAGFDARTVTGSAVFARVDPGQKLELVEALQARGEVVAMTGDGVNDAPALRRADIGVALGRRGSDVARDAADMVITDDSLGTIVMAVRQGRGIYANICKVVDYLVAGNISEVTVVIVGLLLFPEIGIPLLPLQLLWVNLLTDGLPALALSVDPVNDGLMRVPPRRRGHALLGVRTMTLLAVRGLVIAAGALTAMTVTRFAWGLPWAHARGVLFTTLVIGHLLYALVARRGTGLARGRQAANWWLGAAIMAELALQIAITAWPPAQALFDTEPLALREWLLVATAGAIPSLVLFALVRALPSRRVTRSGHRADRPQDQRPSALPAAKQ